jgi:hypothetical protein
MIPLFITELPATRSSIAGKEPIKPPVMDPALTTVPTPPSIKIPLEPAVMTPVELLVTDPPADIETALATYESISPELFTVVLAVPASIPRPRPIICPPTLFVIVPPLNSIAILVLTKVPIWPEFRPFQYH